MALAHVVFPERLYTDCDSVRIGVQHSSSWAQSSKRRFSRIWTTIASQLDDGPAGLIRLMPAHTAASSTGKVFASDGCPITEVMWSANQMVDMLAKDGAELVRYLPSERYSF